jgi:hypothetical protein
MILGWGLAALFILAGVFCLGIWVGLGLAEDRRQQAEADALEARTREQAAIAAVIAATGAPAPAAGAAAGAGPDWRVPGYADPFPQPGRFITGVFTESAVEVTVVDMAPVQDAPHGGTPSPSASLDELDPAVRRLCEETQQYVAALIARTRHAERKTTW